MDILVLDLRPISTEYCTEKTNLWGQKIICQEHCKQSQVNIGRQIVFGSEIALKWVDNCHSNGATFISRVRDVAWTNKMCKHGIVIY